MQAFEMIRPQSAAEAVQLGAQQGAGSQDQGRPAVRFLAGGTTLLDLMKLNVEQPHQVLDINRLQDGLAQVESTPGSGLKIGALVRNSDLAHHPLVMQRYPVLSQALLSGASAQLRNMATTGGNLLQRTRCVYFRDTATPCNKREPGSGCSAIGGYNRNLAILGGSDNCIATNPSDMNVALTVLEATIHVEGSGGRRAIPIADFYLLPGNTPQRETVLNPGDLITHVTLAPLPAGVRTAYLKLRDRASYEFALSSAAVIVGVNAGNGRISHAKVALGGVGTRPWRSPEAEAVLLNAPANADTFAQAAQAAVRNAVPRSENGFKVDLVQRCLVHALNTVTGTVKSRSV
ncbi:xanthine dehydrogenase family protein subunit M [Oxalobacteraceae bacterium CAVE-383]|nr:xanthine dehydrogenase family protein subunit M [Oxalobacteraceae bacterium CAVE-383]